jgi:hypothetical protein
MTEPKMNWWEWTKIAFWEWLLFAAMPAVLAGCDLYVLAWMSTGVAVCLAGFVLLW